MLAVKKDENSRLSEQLDIYKQMNDRKNEELIALRKNNHSLKAMLGESRKKVKVLEAKAKEC